MGIAFRAVTDSSGTSTHTGAASPVACPAPSARVSGDVLLCQVQDSGTTATIATPSGWTLIESQNTSTTHRSWLYARIADGTSADDFSGVITGPAQWLTDMVAYSGCDVSGAVDATAIVAHAQNNSNATTETVHVGPSVTAPARGGCMVVGFYTEDSVGTPHAFSGNTTTPLIKVPVLRADVSEATQQQDMGIMDAAECVPNTAYTMTANLASAEVINAFAVILAPGADHGPVRAQAELPAPSILLGLHGPGALLLQMAYVRALIRRRWISPPSPAIAAVVSAPPLRVILQSVKRGGNF